MYTLRVIYYWSIHHWELFLIAAIVLRVRWSLVKNDDLKEYGPHLKLGLILVGVAFGIGWVLGLAGPRWLSPVAGCFLAMPAIYFLSKVCDRAFNDFLGGMVFDIIFAEGTFSAEDSPRKREHSLALLRHWRDNGLVSKAYRSARKNLTDSQANYDMWLFAIETAVLYQDSVEKGRQLVLRFLRCKKFTEDQRFFATQQLKAWAASRGVHIQLRQTKEKTQKPLTRAVSLRDKGYFREAENLFRLILEKDPENLAAEQLLIRMYAQDLKEPVKARKRLEKLKEAPHTPDWFSDFIEKSIPEWLGERPRSISKKRSFFKRLVEPNPPQPETKIRLSGAPVSAVAAAPAQTGQHDIAQLLSDGLLNTALEQAELNVKNDPGNFANWKQLLDIHCMGVPSLKKAEKVVRKIEENPNFSVEQKKQANEKLREVKEQRSMLAYRTYS